MIKTHDENLNWKLAWKITQTWSTQALTDMTSKSCTPAETFIGNLFLELYLETSTTTIECAQYLAQKTLKYYLYEVLRQISWQYWCS